MSANAQYLKHFAQVSELLEPSDKDTPARVKPTDKMLMLPPLVKNLRKQKLIMKGLINTLNSKPRKAILKILQKRL